MSDDVEAKLKALQAEVDEQFDAFEKAKKKLENDGAPAPAVGPATETKTTKPKRPKRKKKAGLEEDPLDELQNEVGKSLVTKVAKNQLQKVGTKKAIVAGVATLFLIWFIMKNLGLLILGGVGLAALWFLLDNYLGNKGEDGEEDEDEEDDED